MTAILYSNQFDSDYLEAAHLDGETVLTIASVTPRNQRKAKDGKPIDKPILGFEKAKRQLILCKTNAKAVALMYGNKMDGWVGKEITIFPTKGDFFGKKNVPCIRVKFIPQD
jgi:hypothetical protein